MGGLTGAGTPQAIAIAVLTLVGTLKNSE